MTPLLPKSQIFYVAAEDVEAFKAGDLSKARLEPPSRLPVRYNNRAARRKANAMARPKAPRW